MIERDHRQNLFAIDTAQIYSGWREAYMRTMSFRGGIKWISSNGADYLVRLRDRNGNGKSLGRRSPETEEIYRSFISGRDEAKERLESLSLRLSEQAALNKAVGLARVPKAPALVLRALDEANVAQDLRVVGTHAIYAYESMAAVHCKTDLLASGDVDLLFDPRQKISFVAVSPKMNGSPEGLLGILRRADKSFDLMERSRFRAINSDGFMVDLISPQQDMRQPARLLSSANDFVPVEAPHIEWLVNAPTVESVAIGWDGFPVAIRAPDPRIFSLHKAWLSEQINRDPAKRARDYDQALMVARMVQEKLPMLPMDRENLCFTPAELLDRLPDLLIDEHASPKRGATKALGASFGVPGDDFF